MQPLPNMVRLVGRNAHVMLASNNRPGDVQISLKGELCASLLSKLTTIQLDSRCGHPMGDAPFEAFMDVIVQMPSLQHLSLLMDRFDICNYRRFNGRQPLDVGQKRAYDID
jgi:hypothetical protein